MKMGDNQIQRTMANKISETPRVQTKGKAASAGAGANGIIAPIKFSVKKPRQK